MISWTKRLTENRLKLTATASTTMVLTPVGRNWTLVAVGEE